MTHPGIEEEVPIRIRPVVDQTEAQEVERLLTEQITHRWDDPFPQSFGHDDHLLRPTLIGAWAQDRVIGGAFVVPATFHADQYAAAGYHDAAQSIRQNVAIIHAIAVSPDHRREGIGLQIKLFCDAWAAQHHAALVLSVPTNQAAARLNEEAGHTVLPPGVALTLQPLDAAHRPLGPVLALGRDDSQGFSVWAYRIVAKPTGTSLRIGKWDRRQP